MAAPTLDITIGERGPASPIPGDVSALFAAGLTDRGPVGTVSECLSLGAVKAIYGDVQTYSHMIRTAEAYFREGGARMIISRIVGSGADKGSLDLSSVAPAVVLTFTAISEGDWSDALTFTVTAGTGSGRIVRFENDGIVVFEQEFTTDTALQDALDATGLGVATLGPGSWPIAVAAETAVSGGDDDRASIPTTLAGWTTELDVFDADLGTGSVALPGITTPAAHEALLRHGYTYKRFAIVDGIDSATVATHTSPAATLRALDEIAGYGQLFVPWLKVPGPGAGTVTIPPCGAVAGRMARADKENRAGPGQPAAAHFGEFQWVVDVSQEWALADRDTLSDAGVTVIRNMRGKITPYDGLTLVDPDLHPQYAEASGMRVVLAIYSQAYDALGQYVMEVIDGNRHILSKVEKDLVGICQDWFIRDALYGASAGEAFRVDTGPGVNPDAQLAQRHIAAQMELRTSPFAATVSLLITKVATSDQI
jgi:hypothetical protein